MNTFGEFNTGPVLFTGTVSPAGIISVDVKLNETITKLSTEPQLIAAVDGNLRALPKNIVTIDLDNSTNEDKAKLFVKLRIEGELGQTLETQGTTPAPVVEEVVQPVAAPEVVSQQDIEAKKADIEKRKEEIKMNKDTNTELNNQEAPKE